MGLDPEVFQCQQLGGEHRGVLCQVFSRKEVSCSALGVKGARPCTHQGHVGQGVAHTAKQKNGRCDQRWVPPSWLTGSATTWFYQARGASGGRTTCRGFEGGSIALPRVWAGWATGGPGARVAGAMARPPPLHPPPPPEAATGSGFLPGESAGFRGAFCGVLPHRPSWRG